LLLLFSSSSLWFYFPKKMPSESASAASSTGISAPGGNIYDFPGLLFWALVALVVIFWLWQRGKK